MRYLRSHDHFFARQLAAMRNYVPETVLEPSVGIQYPDGTQIQTTVHELSAFLRLRAIVFDLAALDVHAQAAVVALEHRSESKPFAAKIALCARRSCPQAKQEFEGIPFCTI